MIKIPQPPILIQDLGIKYKNEFSKTKRHYAMYRCECGNIFECVIFKIKTKETQSCGCYHKKIIADNVTTHGGSKTKLYCVRFSMINRCNNRKNNQFFYYGERGIKVCDDWMYSFVAFKLWAIKSGYKEGLSIDRIDVNGNYEPSNCRWVSDEIQARNKRVLMSTNTSGYRGVSFSKDKNKWGASITVCKKQKHIGFFNSSIEAAIAYDKYVVDNNLEHAINGAQQCV